MTRRQIRKSTQAKRQRTRSGPITGALRIIGGKLRGSSLAYTGDPVTRPMKDRVREAVFNLIGPEIKGKHAIDLFAGTGALGLEAISRGASKATLIDRHFPSVDLIRQNISDLSLENQAEAIATDAFYWSRQFSYDENLPLLLFCSPPYDMYLQQSEPLLDVLKLWIQRVGTSGMIVVESDTRFDHSLLPHPENWDVRTYAPAVVSILRMTNELRNIE